MSVPHGQDGIPASAHCWVILTVYGLLPATFKQMSQSGLGQVALSMRVDWRLRTSFKRACGYGPNWRA